MDTIGRLSLEKTLLVLAFLIFLSIPVANAHTITISTSVYFGFPTYGTYINFNSEQTFDTIYRESDYWYFDNYGFQIQNGNLSIQTFFAANRLVMSIYGDSGQTSTTKVYCGDKGKPGSVTGATSWSYNSYTRVATFSVIHSSEQEVVMDWTGAKKAESYVFSNIYVAISLFGLTPLILVGAFLILAIKGFLNFESAVYLVVALIVVAVLVAITLMIISGVSSVF